MAGSTRDGPSFDLAESVRAGRYFAKPVAGSGTGLKVWSDHDPPEFIFSLQPVYGLITLIRGRGFVGPKVPSIVNTFQISPLKILGL